MMPRLSVVVPTTGRDDRLLPFLDALDRQTAPRDAFELLLVFDRDGPTPAVADSLGRFDARVVVPEVRLGPPGARNRGAEAARGEFLVLTEDDVVPAPDWLERILARLDADPAPDVVEGATHKPGGRPVRLLGPGEGTFILCNLVVRRDLYARIGGCHEGYFDPASGLYFREDTDLGWMLEEAGARIVGAPEAVVVHPEEHPRFLDPLRWTRRYVMDGLLAARFPDRFHERIEVHRVGPFRVRRPVVRASLGYVAALAAAAAAALARQPGVAAWLLLPALACLAVVWAKWRFDPRRLPVVPLVPFGLLLALVKGSRRARNVRRYGGPAAA